MNNQISILIASDHAGIQMKQNLKQYLESGGFKVVDLGTHSEDAVDYPDYGHQLGKLISKGEYVQGISICGSGNGINMTTNKYKGIRGALCWNEEIAELARKHNDANVCSLPARFITQEMAEKIVDVFLSTDFEGGRHEVRIRKIDI